LHHSLLAGPVPFGVTGVAKVSLSATGCHRGLKLVECDINDTP
jgi:hypothetical protein